MADYKLRLLTSLQDSDYFKINDTDGIPFGIFKTNALPGMLQTPLALSSGLQVVKDSLGNSSGLALTTQYARFGVSGGWFITLNNSIAHSAGNPLNINSDFGAITLGAGTITPNGLLTIKGGGSNIASFRDNSNVEKGYISNTGVFASNQRFYFMPNGDYLEGSHNSGFTLLYSAQKIALLSVAFPFQFYGTGIFTLGGSTSSFPAIKRNNAEIQIRLADDSAYANIDANVYKTGGVSGVSYTGPVNNITVTNGIITAIS